MPVDPSCEPILLGPHVADDSRLAFERFTGVPEDIIHDSLLDYRALGQRGDTFGRRIRTQNEHQA
jgi:hypothetical protein